MGDTLHFRYESPENVTRLCMLAMWSSSKQSIINSYIKQKHPAYIEWRNSKPKVIRMEGSMPFSCVDSIICSKLDGRMQDECDAYVLKLMTDLYDQTHFKDKLVTTDVIRQLLINVLKESDSSDYSTIAYRDAEYAIFDKILNVCIDCGFTNHEECLMALLAIDAGEQWAEMSRDARESFISKNYDIKNCNNLLALMHDLSSDTDICFSSEEVARIAHCKTEQYAELKLCIEDILGKSL